MWYKYRVRCLQTAFGEWHQLCHLGCERVHADDALEPPRVWVEQVRERLEDFDLFGAYQRLEGTIDEPSLRTRLQQSKQWSEASALQGQIKGKIPVLCNGGRESNIMRDRDEESGKYTILFSLAL